MSKSKDIKKELLEEARQDFYGCYLEDGKFYRVNIERNNICYCANNVIIDNGEVIKLNPEKQILIDCFVLDLEKKEIKTYDNRVDKKIRGHIIKAATDSFVDGLANIENIVIKSEREKIRRIILKIDGQKDIEITVDSCGNIIGYSNENLKNVGNGFLRDNRKLKKLSLPSLTSIENVFLSSNVELRKLNLPLLTSVGDWFLSDNKGLSELSLPSLTSVGNNFLSSNERLSEVNLPLLVRVGSDFLWSNEGLSELSLPSLTSVGYNFLSDNEKLSKLDLPSLTNVEAYFLSDNKGLSELHLPLLTSIGDWFLRSNEGVREKILAEIEERKKEKSQ